MTALLSSTKSRQCESQHAEYQDPETEATKLSQANVNKRAIPIVTCQNACGENTLFLRCNSI